MLASILLAGKTEDSFIFLPELSKIYNKYSDASILAAETTLLEVSPIIKIKTENEKN
jgi:hypothetical protein